MRRTHREELGSAAAVLLLCWSEAGRGCGRRRGDSHWLACLFLLIDGGVFENFKFSINCGKSPIQAMQKIENQIANVPYSSMGFLVFFLGLLCQDLKT